MAECLQIIYASRATFKPNTGGGIDRDVARVLMQSRRNNSKLDVGGVLYYGDGCFFQCLEGPPSSIDEIFAKIAADPRHNEIQVLLRRTLSDRTFATWSMKYVPAQEEVRQLLRQKGLATFDPYKFDTDTIDSMIGILSMAKDPTGGAKRLPEAALFGGVARIWQLVILLLLLGSITFLLLQFIVTT